MKEKIKEIIGAYYQLSQEEFENVLKSKRRYPIITEPKFIYRYIMIKVLRQGLKPTALETGATHHTTVMSSINQVQSILDYKFKDAIKSKYESIIFEVNQLLDATPLRIKNLCDEISEDLEKVKQKQIQIIRMVELYEQINNAKTKST